MPVTPPMQMRLGAEHIARLDHLCARFPAKTRTEMVRDLIDAEFARACSAQPAPQLTRPKRRAE